MKQILIPAIMLTLVITVLTGLVYPLVVTGLAQVLFPGKANGELIRRNGVTVGSRIAPYGQDSSHSRHWMHSSGGIRTCRRDRWASQPRIAPYGQR